jgi:hypothetical protein
MPNSAMPTPVEAAIGQIVVTFCLVAPDRETRTVRTELESYLDDLFYDGVEDVQDLAIAGLRYLTVKYRRAA